MLRWGLLGLLGLLACLDLLACMATAVLTSSYPDLLDDGTRVGGGWVGG